MSSYQSNGTTPSGLSRNMKSLKLNGNGVVPPAGVTSTIYDKVDEDLTTITLAGIGTYVVNLCARGVVLFFPDADDTDHVIRDYLAKQGFTVLIFDYFGGKPCDIPPKDMRDEYEKWAKLHQERVKEMIPSWWEAVREKYDVQTGSVTPYFVVGRGFGAPFALELCTVTNPQIVAGAVIHPDFIETSHIDNADKPVLFSFSNTNPFYDSDREIYPWVMYATVLGDFGFGTDPETENEGYAMIETAHSVSEWFIRGNNVNQGPQ
ncbi:hypothetical protein SCHPADRAFT_946204 [Schizopora paradoxa]|uniref:Dienelactone hydrolase domain-containing protein n=1 Tax=Schizopora paradoxa TaxID=27342 RepID=A0A0H2R3E0_9AGAM|nr:hypothetical protein SCHPADRAFT_946204 [Schizopora paradoxa]